ncbi:MAG: discoidin domain-containing protein, partial [Planctomycetota bacterium]
PPDFGVNEGNVWSFRTEFYSYPIDGANISATASSLGQADFGPENTINGSGLDENDLHSTDAADMWLSDTEPQGAWIQYELDKVYKLHEMWVWNSNQVFEALFGFGLKDVTVEYSTDGATWTTLAGAPEFAQAPGTPDYGHNTTVDFGGAPAKYVKLTAASNWGGILPQYSLSEVRFFFIPVSATTPSPDSGATDVAVDATLSWRAGRGAVTHNVSLSTDEQAVIDGTAPVAAMANASYSPAALDLSTSYYWKVAEVNETETPSTWESGVWSFTTSDSIVVEDFEAYSDYPPDEIYTTWPDGYENPANGSQVGNLSPPFAETTIVHGGNQSMPLFYSNTGGAAFSEGTRTFAVPQNWTKHGVKALVLYFYGTAGNTGQMYVKVNGTKIPYDGNPGNLALTAWQVWSIDLVASGLNVQSVSSLAVGIDGNGASGTLYFDDIGLYAVAPEPPNEWRINAGNDDAEEEVSGGGIDRGSSDLELGHEGAASATSLQTVGCRWVGVPIPKGATITEAWVQFSANDINNDRHIPDVSVVIEGELSASPATFSSTARDISSRPTTAASVVWDVPRWTTTHAMGPEERTPDISSIIQEIVNQPNWAGEAIVLMFRDNPAKPSQGTREAESFDGTPDEAPLLHISYQ